MPQNKPLNELTLDELLQKARESQNKMKSVQNKLASAVVIGIAGNQEVQIKITGKYNVISTTISDSAYADKERLEQLITIAINDAMYKLELITKE
jgi:DNA-binding YbaB/EbfC family protein